uniref:NADH-ubiquinone oxidoreductase chain 4L n=1 Tax=Ilyocoris cimicoides TaxID=280203 RepID=C5HIS2_9HEMI|nr:NADH dehydrogenase subunit 4L [Ilyocoris cimicoides]ACJ69517.1 NADH dehydrogenase subunit 4L [Ilyocoris cimicoides]
MYLNYELFFYCLLVFSLFCGLLVFCSTRSHLLLTLLSLEFIVLVIFLTLFYFLVFYGYEGYFSLIFLTFSVCEGALGLSILVSLIRCHGNDNISSLSALMW